MPLLVDHGYSKLPAGEKRSRVDQVFSSVSGRYDLMNDLMSAGLHRLWKRFAVHLACLHSGEIVLDAAAGTGDLSLLCERRVGRAGQIVLLDRNREMINLARDRLIDRGLVRRVRYVQGSVEQLPFPDECFDCILIAFGLRNVADKEAALRSMYHKTRPGGRLLVLEFSRPVFEWSHALYRRYCLNYLPWLGQCVAGDADSYRYLGESIMVQPGQAEVSEWLRHAGYDEVECYNLSGGIVALHRGYRL